MAYYFVFLLVSLLALLGNSKFRNFIFLLMIIILSLFAGTRLNVDNDYSMYFSIFRFMDDNFQDFQDRIVPLEPTMYVIPKFFGFFFDNNKDVIISSFFLFSFIGVLTKIIAIKRFSEFVFLSVILYASDLFFMQEMTTIRAGVAAGFFLLSIDDLYMKKNKSFFIKIAICLLFHSSSILYVIPWIVFRFRTNIKYFYYALIISFILALLKFNIITFLFLDRIFPRVDIYIKAMDWMENEDVNIFNFKALFALFIVLFSAINYKKLKDVKYFEIFFKIHIISLCIFYLLSSSAQVFSIRSFEMFSIINLLFYPLIIHAFAPKFKPIGWVIIIVFAIIQLYYMIDVAGIFKPYKSWLF